MNTCYYTEMDIGHSGHIHDKVVYLITDNTHVLYICTNLGSGLLEAPREYVLHGPLLATY